MKGFCLEVSGDYACFTRPYLSVERVSYDVITPSAARAIYDAIFWKPAIRWRITKIEVLNPVKFASLKRNEVKSVASEKKGSIIIEKDRTQRTTTLLKDVKYRIWAEFDYFKPEDRHHRGKNKTPEWMTAEEEKEFYDAQPGRDRSDESPAKYAAMFERRAKKGQFFHQPYLGCKEFPCSSFRLIDISNISKEPKAIEESRDLGYMLFDRVYSDKINACLYRANMVNGVIKVPHPESEEVKK